MSYQLDILLRKTATLNFLQNQTCKETCLADLLSVANRFGYSFSYWKESKIWLKNEEITKENYTVYTDRQESVKSPETTSTPILFNCPSCNKLFEKKPKNKKFCCEQCKNNFNNAKKSVKNR